MILAVQDEPLLGLSPEEIWDRMALIGMPELLFLVYWLISHWCCYLCQIKMNLVLLQWEGGGMQSHPGYQGNQVQPRRSMRTTTLYAQRKNKIYWQCIKTVDQKMRNFCWSLLLRFLSIVILTYTINVHTLFVHQIIGKQENWTIFGSWRASEFNWAVCGRSRAWKVAKRCLSFEKRWFGTSKRKLKLPPFPSIFFIPQQLCWVNGIDLLHCERSLAFQVLPVDALADWCCLCPLPPSPSHRPWRR